MEPIQFVNSSASKMFGWVAVLSFLCGSSAFAGGLEVPDFGTVALGRGAAFVARADNLSAFYYNPAGLSKSKGPNLLVGLNMMHSSVDYLRSGAANPETETVTIDGIEVRNPGLDYGRYDPFSSDPPPEYSSVSLKGAHFPVTLGATPVGLLPSLIFNWGDIFNVEGLSVAAGMIPPTSYAAPTYPKDGAQRYAIREANFLILYPGVGVSYAFNKYIQVGAVFMSGVALLEQSQAIRPLPQKDDTISYSEDLGGDANLKVDVADWFMPTGVIGLLSRPLEWLELGASVKLPVVIRAKGTAKYTAPELAQPDSAFVAGRDKVVLEQHFPLVVRAGARYVQPRWDIELDFIWENWSSLSHFDVKMDAVLDTDAQDPNAALQEMPDSKVLKNFRDTFSVRLGGDFDVLPKVLAIRAGAYYQSSAYPKNNETFSLDFPYAHQIGLSCGLTWHMMEMVDVNVGYLHVFQPEVNVTKGIVQQQGLPMEDENGEEKNIGNTVNNGTYNVALNLFGLSMEGHF